MFKKALQYLMNQKKNNYTRLHNVYNVRSVKSSIYSIPEKESFKFLRYLKGYYLFAKNTRILESLFSCFTIILLVLFVYLLSIFLCAIDSTCASFYMEAL